LFLATVGSTLGNLFNYFVGKVIGLKLLKDKERDKEFQRMKRIANKYGFLGLFVLLAIPLPLPVDIVTVFAGVSKMDIKYFTITVFFGKLVKYLFYTGLIELVLVWL
jgi:membrane protein YqaA with SNARE-associated domain